MSRWQHKIDIKSIIDSYNSEEMGEWDDLPEEITSKLVLELKKLDPNPGSEFAENIERYVCDLEDCVTVADLDSWLQDWYDFCDAERIFCGI